MPLLVTQADYNIAYLYYLRGSYSRAIAMMRVLASILKIGDAYHHALLQFDLAGTVSGIESECGAGELAQQGYDGFHKLGMRKRAQKCLAFSAMAASQIGRAFEG